MHDIRRFIPNLMSVLLLICSCEFIACTHPVRRLVFQPHKIEIVPPFPEDATHLERFWLKTEQGDVEWWLFEGDGIDTSHQGPAVLMAHGNRELIDFYLNRAETYQRMGFTVLLGEYRGYGRSAGQPSRKQSAQPLQRSRSAARTTPASRMWCATTVGICSPAVSCATSRRARGSAPSPGLYRCPVPPTPSSRAGRGASPWTAGARPSPWRGASATAPSRSHSTTGEHDVRAVFPEDNANPKVIASMVRETGVKVGGGLYAGTLPPASPTYESMMRSNITTIVESLVENL